MKLAWCILRPSIKSTTSSSNWRSKGHLPAISCLHWSPFCNLTSKMQEHNRNKAEHPFSWIFMCWILSRYCFFCSSLSESMSPLAVCLLVYWNKKQNRKYTVWTFPKSTVIRFLYFIIHKQLKIYVEMSANFWHYCQQAEQPQIKHVITSSRPLTSKTAEVMWSHQSIYFFIYYQL